MPQRRRKRSSHEQRPKQANHTKHPASSPLRLLVASPLPVTAAGIEGMLKVHSDLDVMVSSADELHLEEIVRDINPDALILDIGESDSGGDSTAGLISRLAKLVPTVILTTSVPAFGLARALQAGVRGLLSHGVTAEELIAAVRAAAQGLTVLERDLADQLALPFRALPDDLELPPERLTGREQEVLAMLASGLLNKEIAGRLGISEHTVKFHVSSIMAKLGASSRTEAVTKGLRLGILLL